MSLLEELGKKEVWQDFRSYKEERNQLNKKELQELDVLIEHQEYLKVMTGSGITAIPSAVSVLPRQPLTEYVRSRDWMTAMC